MNIIPVLHFMRQRFLPVALWCSSVAWVVTADDKPLRAADSFEVDGHKACLHAAPGAAKPKPWVWYAPALKGGMSISQRTLYMDRFLQAGISIAGFDLGEVRGSPASSAKFTRFYEAMVQRGYSPKPILFGQSRGGLMMLAWGVRNPACVRAFVGVYPVCNLASWPMKNMAVTLADYGLTESEFKARLDELNPIHHLQGLLANQVPVFIVHGDADVVVPYKDNTGLLRERYEAGGGKITVKIIPGEGHKGSPSFFECPELVNFVLSVAK